jgi:hypothetical protein
MFSFERHADRIDVACDGVAVGTYLHEHTQLTRPAWVNLRSATGRQISREFPAADPENNDHPLFHPGLWISYGHLDGYDFWRLASPTLHNRFLTEPAVSEEGGLTFEVRNRYVTASHGTFLCMEDVKYSLSRSEAGMLLTVDIHYRNPDRDFYFGDQEESGIGIRLASAFRVDTGTGRILNDQGDENGAGVWGKEARWVDFSATFDGARAGVLFIMHPDNPRPCWMHARDYGLVVANPFPRQPAERAEPYVQTWVPKGEIFRLRFGMLMYDIASDSIDHEAEYASYVQGTREVAG